MEEVRFDRMVPKTIVARRRECNLAYLPVGSLEWHGSHMPFGTDYMTVGYLAEEAARRFGGVAFPPHVLRGCEVYIARVPRRVAPDLYPGDGRARGLCVSVSFAKRGRFSGF